VADISIPGISSRFDTDKMVEGLMKVERLPRERVEQGVETLKTQKTSWQALGRRITALREGANLLYSYQNPFNERTAVSSNSGALDASASRDARDQQHSFTVKQLAQADKFISNPLDQNYRVGAGNYQFSTGKSDVSFKFNGGSLQEFSDTLNKRGQGKITSGLIAVKPGTRSFIIESLVTGAENRLQFENDALKFAVDTGIVNAVQTRPEIINIKAVPVNRPGGLPDAAAATVQGNSLKVAASSETSVDMNGGIKPTASMFLKFETALTMNPAALAVDAANARAREEAAAAAGGGVTDAAAAGGVTDADSAGGVSAAGEVDAALAAASDGEDGVPPAPTDAEIIAGAAREEPDGGAPGDGESVAAAGDGEAPAELQATETEPLTGAPESGNAELAEGAEAAEGALAAAETRPVGVPVIPRVENLNVLALKFADGGEAELLPLAGGENWTVGTYNLFEISGGKTVASIEIRNNNTHRDVSIRNIQVMDTSPKSASAPVKAISTARDAIVLMDGIEIERPDNTIDDLVPGLNLKLKSVSDTPVNLDVESNTAAIKDALFTLVGSYNRLMAELNVLTRSDESVINELSYLNDGEREELRGKLGQFSGETALSKLRNDLIGTVTASYPTATDGNVLLANFGIATDVRRAGAGGYDPSRMRGYLEIDETALDAALAANAGTLKELMGRDSDGDLIVDSGLAWRLERTVRPFVETGGIIASKTGVIDTRVTADNRRIESLDQQLDRKERDLRIQYGRMEDAYSRMEQMSRSLDNFGAQNSNKR
jgi:flagellar capping protein FliD